SGAGPATSAAASPAPGAMPSAGPLPPGGEDDLGLPAGHPALDDANPHAHGNAGGGTMPGVFNPPEDTEQPDATLPPGTIVVELHDADDKPVAGEQITLGILINSVAQGDSRKHLQGMTDDHGRTTFSSLDLASNTAYRVSTGYQGGAFAAMPFQLAQAKAMRVVLHVYPVTHDIQKALIVTEATIACEVREDRIQVEQALTIYNLGRTAWQPDGVTMKLPDGATAFNAQASMSDQGVDDVGDSAKLRGTFPPGRHPVEFRWQLPWSGDKDVDFVVGMPPHVAIARVMMPATSDIKLLAQGFPPSEVRHDQQGQSFLVTERRLRPDEAKLTTLSLGIHGLPTVGPGRLIASLLAACGVVVGLAFAFAGRSRRSTPGGVKARRSSLLADLADLERAHAAGDVGPRTYERARRELIDAIARTLAGAGEPAKG
ncbi:MAG: hypothetical protein ACRELB_07730, partial [Polyangiaceae bacterium]